MFDLRHRLARINTVWRDAWRGKRRTKLEYLWDGKKGLEIHLMVDLVWITGNITRKDRYLVLFDSRTQSVSTGSKEAEREKKYRWNLGKGWRFLVERFRELYHILLSCCLIGRGRRKGQSKRILRNRGDENEEKRKISTSDLERFSVASIYVPVLFTCVSHPPASCILPKLSVNFLDRKSLLARSDWNESLPRLTEASLHTFCDLPSGLPSGLTCWSKNLVK